MVTSVPGSVPAFFIMTDKIVVLSTCGSVEEAEKIARLLVERQLAACVNVLAGLQSIYRWEGAVESAAEWLLVIKSSRARFDELRVALEAAHSYKVPEILALPVVEGSQNYLNWLDASLQA
jgi:periplasmic divalent cation tolerance protein